MVVFISSLCSVHTAVLLGINRFHSWDSVSWYDDWQAILPQLMQNYKKYQLIQHLPLKIIINFHKKMCVAANYCRHAHFSTDFLILVMLFL